MGHDMRLDYGKYTKRGFVSGVLLLLVGVLGNALGPGLLGPLPGWEETLLIDMMIGGILIGFCSVIVFGIVLPLTE